MKKYLSILCALAMLSGMVGCSSSKESSESENSSSVTTTTTEKPTETTTQKPTEAQTTEAQKESYDLEEVHKIGNISIKLPKDCSIDSTTTDSGSAEFITFPDSSVLQISETISPYSLVGLEESEKVLLLNTYAESFVSSDTWDKDSDPEETSINGCTAVKQDATVLNVGKSRLYHFLYEDSIYTIGFSKMSKTATASYDLQDDIIKSLELLGTTATPQKSEPVKEDSTSLGQKNALDSAKGYLKFMNFSYEGLIEQLEYENFSHDEAVYAADNCGADWNAEAVGCAKSYIDSYNFSYQGLIEQLEYEKFTHEQAVYGADGCGADWNQEAAESAASYMSSLSMSRQDLLDQLLYEGFTEEQAEYGVQSVGY